MLIIFNEGSSKSKTLKGGKSCNNLKRIRVVLKEKHLVDYSNKYVRAGGLQTRLLTGFLARTSIRNQSRRKIIN
jgi:hypothetical protein